VRSRKTAGLLIGDTYTRRWRGKPQRAVLWHLTRSVLVSKNARDLQETSRTIPLDRLLVETDSPFLAPVPHRGQTCEPAFVADTAAFLAELRGEPIEVLAGATTANFFKLFGKAAA
jgi:TatD DNase family protein